MFFISIKRFITFGTSNWYLQIIFTTYQTFKQFFFLLTSATMEESFHFRIIKSRVKLKMGNVMMTDLKKKCFSNIFMFEKNFSDIAPLKFNFFSIKELWQMVV